MNKLFFFTLIAAALVMAPGCRDKAPTCSTCTTCAPAEETVVMERESGPMQADAGLEEADLK